MNGKTGGIHYLFGTLLVIIAALWSWSVFGSRQQQAHVRKQILQAEAAMRVWDEQRKENPATAPAVPANFPVISDDQAKHDYHQGLVYRMVRLYTLLAFQVILIGWITIAYLRRRDC
jgi:hypothetical protein